MTRSESLPIAAMIIRGKIVESDLLEFGGRGGELHFLAPDALKHIDELALSDPQRMSDLYELSLDDIANYFHRLGERLDPATNPHLNEAREIAYRTAPTTPPLLDSLYAALPYMFKRDYVLQMAEANIGRRYIDGWVEQKVNSGRSYKVRAFGSRTVHVVAGNAPVLSGLSLIRSAIIRCDAIIKAPSNDPFTAMALGKTMIEMAPHHPITRHFSVAYWRGGDESFEQSLYRPQNVEKIVAWGGLNSVKHVTKYIQPGLELIALDPKLSGSLVGKEAFDSDETLREVALKIACDMGVMNQQGCSSARVVHVESGTDEKGIAKLNKLGQYVYQELIGLHSSISTVPRSYPSTLRAHVRALLNDEEFGWYKVIGGQSDEGAVIVSQIPQPVDFADLLDARTSNLVPIDHVQEMISRCNSYTQTVGIYPNALLEKVANLLSLGGAQRLVPLGWAMTSPDFAPPQDGIEPIRRMAKWIVVETEGTSTPVWQRAGQQSAFAS